MATTLAYLSLDAFYDADERRWNGRRGEHDFGVWWYGPEPHSRRWRISWNPASGEIYAYRFSPERVEVLAEVEDVATVRSLLAGWENICGHAHSLEWVRIRLGATS